MIEIIEADFLNNQHCKDYIRLLNEYAIDVMGGGTPLSAHVQNNLTVEIAQRDSITVFLAYELEKAVALVTCMEGFSTFQSRPLMNIHDVYVDASYRGQGISTKLLKSAERLAIKYSCCKLTLEVLQGNEIAKTAYLNFGFKGYELNPKVGNALFWEKKLD